MNNIEAYAELLLNAADEATENNKISDYTMNKLEALREVLSYEDRMKAIQLLTKMMTKITESKNK